jgi:transcriptional regulator with XRE-family HTH domain
MTHKSSFATALRTVRKARGLSQEAFSDVSSRTYLSSLERGLKSPTLNKVAELCEVLDVHPLTVFALAYAADTKSLDKLIARVRQEVDSVLTSPEARGR